MKEEEIQIRVIAFMDQWLAYAKNAANVQCPVANIHHLDNNYYRKRILQYNDIAVRVDEGRYSSTSELHILMQKYNTIFCDFEDLYRRSHGMPRREVVTVGKIIKQY